MIKIGNDNLISNNTERKTVRQTLSNGYCSPCLAKTRTISILHTFL